MRPVGFGCLNHSHTHEVIVPGRTVYAGVTPIGILTLWRCATEHRLGGYWNDLRRDPTTIASGGPLP